MLDVRFPVGVMFATMGALLAGYGLLGDQAIYSRSLGININLIWGGVMIVFAACLLTLAVRARTREDPRAVPPAT